MPDKEMYRRLRQLGAYHQEHGEIQLAQGKFLEDMGNGGIGEDDDDEEKKKKKKSPLQAALIEVRAKKKKKDDDED